MTCSVKEGFLFWKKKRYVYFWLIYWSDDTFSVDFRTKYFDKNEDLYKNEAELIRRCFSCIEKKLDEIRLNIVRNDRLKDKSKSKWVIKPLFDEERDW